MKLFRKLNRGAILTFLIMMGVVIYLVALSANQQAEIPRIKTVTEQYVQAEVAWQMLPAVYRTGKPAMPDAELQAYIAEQSAKIQSFYIDNEPIVQSMIRRLKAGLVQQAKGQGIIYDYQKTVSKFERFEFEADMVTVRLISQTIFDGSDGGLGSARAKSVGETSDTIILQKAGVDWKVVYASLGRPYGDRPGIYDMQKAGG